MNITINVNNKIASNVKDAPIVCGNTNYRIDFILDDEWTGYTTDTYVYYAIDGDGQDALPLMYDSNGFYVILPAIQSGNTMLIGLKCNRTDSLLYTTSSARIDLIKAISNYTYDVDEPGSYRYEIRYGNDGRLHLFKNYGDGAMIDIETVEFPVFFTVGAPTVDARGCLLYSFEEPIYEE